MILSEEFLRHAVECQHMAKFAHDAEVRRAWSRMAERWNRCAELAKSRENALHVSKVRAQRQSAHPD